MKCGNWLPLGLVTGKKHSTCSGGEKQVGPRRGERVEAGRKDGALTFFAARLLAEVCYTRQC